MQMGYKIIFILITVSTLTSRFAFSQEITAKKDSTQLYKSIETYSKRSKFGGYLYNLIFKPISSPKPAEKVYPNPAQRSYAPFEGKIIRHINIETLDPFGYSLTDTTPPSLSKFSELGNKWHIKTHGITIRNLLIIRQNQRFDSLRVKESERLVRSQGYVHEVSFFVKPASKNSDSVDVYIRELDNWTIVPSGTIPTTQLAINLTDKNFLGLGHQFQEGFTWYHTNGELANNINYFIPNIRNTYINSTLNYGTDQHGNFTKSFAIDRPFFSPLAKWAGGASISTQFKIDSVKDVNGFYVPFHPKFNTQDYWAGKAIRIFKGNTEGDRVTNLILTARYLRIGYIEKPPELYDPYHIYSSEDFYFFGVGLSARKYIQDKYIFGFGIIEDVPVGRVYSITGGYQIKNGVGRYYLGAQISYGNYQSWGYWSADYEYGTFFNGSRTEQGEITAGINYFTPLIKVGKWKFRQFAKPQVTFGLNRLPYDSLTLNKNFGLQGFNSRALNGTERMVLILQTQSYAPWNVLGFNFGPFFNYSLGILGNSNSGFKRSKVYSQIGIGVQIKNERFVFNTFQFSLSFYPLIPGKGRDVININSFQTTDFGFKDFQIGKPTTLVFQ
jgi:hypothetical protein